MILRYTGGAPYRDPAHRFEVKAGDRVEVTQDEGTAMLGRHPDQWERAEAPQKPQDESGGQEPTGAAEGPTAPESAPDAGYLMTPHAAGELGVQ